MPIIHHMHTNIHTHIHTNIHTYIHSDMHVEELFAVDDVHGAVLQQQQQQQNGLDEGIMRRVLLSPEAEAELLKATHARHEAAEKRAVELHRREMHLKQVNTVRALELAIREKGEHEGEVMSAATQVLERQLAEAVEALREFF
jgi:hypothetical protein